MKMVLISGTAGIYDIEEKIFLASGSYFDPYRYPVIEQHEVDDDLWKCESCRKVYRMQDTLECKSCGTSITEKSRFVLK